MLSISLLFLIAISVYQQAYSLKCGFDSYQKSGNVTFQYQNTLEIDFHGRRVLQTTTWRQFRLNIIYLS